MPDSGSGGCAFESRRDHRKKPIGLYCRLIGFIVCGFAGSKGLMTVYLPAGAGRMENHYEETLVPDI
jgi:hypothetical protein